MYTYYGNVSRIVTINDKVTLKFILEKKTDLDGVRPPYSRLTIQLAQNVKSY